MRILSVVAALAVAACQPMYKAAPAKLHEPEAVEHPAKDPTEATAKAPQATQCNPERSVAAKTIPPQQKAEAGGLVNLGDAKVKQFNSPATTDDRATLIRRAIDDYRAALLKDPYNVDATLQLARAYDVAHHQGCALVMLKRLELLSQTNPAAATAVNDVDTNEDWFADYRTEAKAAIKR